MAHRMREQDQACKVGHCRVCLAVFPLVIGKRRRSKFCSNACGKQNAIDQLRSQAAARKQITPKCCVECGREFTAAYGDKRRIYCSDACNMRSFRRVKKPIERARLRTATIERVDPYRVFERDGWRCQICHRPTPKRLRGTMNERAPELDHIIPLSKGGEHSYRNTQCACRACNGAKSASVYGQLNFFI